MWPFDINMAASYSLMKKLIITLYIACVLVQTAMSAPKQRLEPAYAWRASNPLGLRLETSIDTLFENYARRSVPSAVSDEWASTGNLGGEGINMIWSERPAMSEFFFRDAISAWLPSEQTMKYYNSRIPMTLLSYNASGGRETAQERLTGHFSGNINRRAQVGALVDYLYSKGSYANQAVKDLTWGVSGSYMGDRYEFQGFYNHYNALNKENGGITDDLYITDPAQLQGGVSSINTKSIPTRLTQAHTRYVGGQFWMNNRYKIGYWHEEPTENDTIVKRTYVPVMSFIWTMDYSFGKHLFLNGAPGEATDFFDRTYFSGKGTRDDTRYSAITNTVGVSMIEGFSRFAKFGLAAYARHQYRSYTQTPDTMLADAGEIYTPLPDYYDNIKGKQGENLLWVGAQLTKQRGSVLRYDITGELGLVGPAAGDVNITGRIDTRFRLLGDTVGLTAYGHFKNMHAPYLMNYYRSNHFIWYNDFGKTRSFRAGGRLDISHTGTMVDVGVENVQNHIYFGPDCVPVQHSGSVQILTARLGQKLKVGILHWDNSLIYQTTTDDAVIPLPKFGVYSNLYLLFKVATLKVQLGVDCDYYTRYYAPGYQPATMGFYNQRDVKVGNYPFMNVYANMKLSKARFYVMFSHINQGWMGSDYFSLPHYPMNPRRFQMGISVDFAN